jgi:HK97 family phage portal protein
MLRTGEIIVFSFGLFAPQASTGSLSDDRWWSGLSGLFGGWTSKSNQEVNETTAYSLAAYYAAIRVISEDVGKIPCILYRRMGRGKERATDHPVYRLIHGSPNYYSTQIAFRSAQQAHLAGHGNCFSEIERDQQGNAVALHPIHPFRVTPKWRNIADCRQPGDVLFYEVTQCSGQTKIIESADMLHPSGLGSDGVTGYSVLRFAVESLGVAMSAQEFGAAFFANGMRPSGILQRPPGKEMTSEQINTLREQFGERYGGSGKAGLPAVLDGLEWKQMSVPPEEAQFLETRTFQIEEICRWFRIPPHKLQHLARSTNNNIEHQAIEYVQDGLTGWLTRWEQEITRKLLKPEEQEEYVAEFLVEGLLRGDFQTRMQGYATGINNGFMTPNTAAERENLPIIPAEEGGDTYFMQGAMSPLKKLVREADSPAPEPPAPQNEDESARAAASLASRGVARLLRKEQKQMARIAPKEYSEMDWAREVAKVHAMVASDISDELGSICKAFGLEPNISGFAYTLVEGSYAKQGEDAVAQEMETRHDTLPEKAAEWMRDAFKKAKAAA